MSSLLRLLVTRARDLHADKRGSAAVIAAIVFPIAIGGMGLGAETGYWYLSQRKLQHAADVSAHAAGVRLRAGDNTAQLTAVALNIATLSGLSSSIGTIVVNAPPLSGAKAGVAGNVEVILTEVQPRLFSSVYSSQPVTIRTRAVATIVTLPQAACVLALSPTASGAITVSGSTNVTLTGCDVASNSNSSNSFLMSGGTLSAGCVSAVGGASAVSGLTLTSCTAVKTQAPVVRDPYAAVPEPSAIGSCQATIIGTTGGTVTLTPTDNQPNGVKSMRFCNGMSVRGTVTFSPGVYIIENGGLGVNGNAHMVGSGVTFYFANGGYMSLSSNGIVNLSAPTSGPFSGILFFASRTTAAASQTMAGNAGSTLQGAIYMPASNITFAGSSSTTNGCTQVIGSTVTFTGNSSLGSNCAAAGTSLIATSEPVQIAE